MPSRPACGLRCAHSRCCCCSAASALDTPACPGTSGSAPLALPHLRSAVNHRIEAVVVALGSSSTQGAMASDLAHSYPAVLQQVLSAGLPDAHIAVINRGVGGQDAAEELARLNADVLAVRPQLVIWQVGANGALRNADPAGFRDMVTTGVRRIAGRRCRCDPDGQSAVAEAAGEGG